jgi:hypothetical protein
VEQNRELEYICPLVTYLDTMDNARQCVNVGRDVTKINMEVDDAVLNLLNDFLNN